MTFTFLSLPLISFISATDLTILKVIGPPVVGWLYEQLWPVARRWLVNKAISLLTSNEAPKGVGNMSRSERRRALRAAARSGSTSSAAPSRLLGSSRGERLRAKSKRHR